MEGKPKFCHHEAAWGILMLSCLFKKQDSGKKSSALPPTYPAPEIPIAKPALGREPEHNHLENLHAGFTQVEC